ncbi:MAG: hypothetical protein ING69_10660 [Rhodocyclaceae bacterium]|nr:hypothetical protein [Rhodocyclaceae bacterium]
MNVIVASGAGGVGKTTIAELARVAMTRRGQAPRLAEIASASNKRLSMLARVRGEEVVSPDLAKSSSIVAYGQVASLAFAKHSAVIDVDTAHTSSFLSFIAETKRAADDIVFLFATTTDYVSIDYAKQFAGQIREAMPSARVSLVCSDRYSRLGEIERDPMLAGETLYVVGSNASPVMSTFYGRGVPLDVIADSSVEKLYAVAPEHIRAIYNEIAFEAFARRHMDWYRGSLEIVDKAIYQ